ncbi:lytic transglycosylase domain-containing protein [Sphingomonas morindae]|uniref:Lytic transglycosylase domain-containing protein n=1 Tax=Sphingomonas morindae TaxID=1541170 RepID=A0ABY4X949_9SPHN|nr:lytic transglycosylase domain-containing protein [Sphingomonas morindae]USI73435.1 lytic transglycosylase domain-containing protein [Sphingomonas morindae]
MIRAPRPAIALSLALALGATAARADVFEIGGDGRMTLRAGAGLVATGDAASADTAALEPAPDVPAAAVTLVSPPAAPAAFQAPLSQAADQAGLSPALLAALVWQESRWQPAARSPKGAVGLTQLMPGTARALSVDPADARASLAGGARYLRRLLDRFDGNVERALAAYNAGPGRVPRGAGLPAIAETRAYVAAILDQLGASASLVRAGVTP